MVFQRLFAQCVLSHLTSCVSLDRTSSGIQGSSVVGRRRLFVRPTKINRQYCNLEEYLHSNYFHSSGRSRAVTRPKTKVNCWPEPRDIRSESSSRAEATAKTFNCYFYQMNGKRPAAHDTNCGVLITTMCSWAMEEHGCGPWAWEMG